MKPTLIHRLTDRARNALSLAKDEAVAFGHDAIGPEHLMLGLIKEGSGIGAAALHEVCDQADRLASAIKQPMVRGTMASQSQELPTTGLTEQAIELAMEERRTQKHNYIGTEHLLLGLLRLPNSPLATSFKAIDVDPAAIRRRLLKLMGDNE